MADMQNRRLQNLKEKTLSYKFNVVHVPGKKNLGPDATSRYPTGAPERLVLPGEPPETDLEHDTTTTDLRAIILAGIMTAVRLQLFPEQQLTEALLISSKKLNSFISGCSPPILPPPEGR